MSDLAPLALLLYPAHMLAWPPCERPLPLLLGCDQIRNLGRACSGRPDFAAHWRNRCPLGLGFPVRPCRAMRVVREKELGS